MTLCMNLSWMAALNAPLSRAAAACSPYLPGLLVICETIKLQSPHFLLHFEFFRINICSSASKALGPAVCCSTSNSQATYSYCMGQSVTMCSAINLSSQHHSQGTSRTCTLLLIIHASMRSDLQ